MSRHSDHDNWKDMRRLVLGLGETSIHKTHYPNLRQRLAELQRFQSMVNLSGDMLIVLDRDTRAILDLNEAARRALVNDDERVVGTPLDAMLPSGSRQALADFLDSCALDSTASSTLTTDLSGADGRIFPVEITGRCGHSGQQHFAVLALRDISERLKSEAHQRQAAAVFKGTHEGVVITDLEANILAVNPAFTHITGYTEAEVLGCNPRILKSVRHDHGFYLSMWEDLSTEGFWQGEIWNQRKDGEIYPELLTISAIHNDLGELTNYVGIFTDLTAIKHSEHQLEHLAHHDPLTGLPNRVLFFSMLKYAVGRALRNGFKGAVLFIDLDRFKTINDSLGHTAGDEVLQVAAYRLNSRLRNIDTAARLGGDEFVVILEELVSPARAAEVAQSLIEQLSEMVLLSDGHEVYVGGSIGISIFPDDGKDAEGLIRNADAALNQAKASGRNTYTFYTEEMTQAAHEKMELEAALRTALENHEMVLYYQPLISLADDRVIGVEALVRWQKPDGELVPPDRFIPLAEETGLIIPLGEWVMREACNTMKQWNDAGLQLDTVAVNLSPLQFHQPELVAITERILQETGLPPGKLELEITEGTIMDEAATTGGKVEQFKAMGVRIAIDDFGTGYSSMAYLKRFVVDKLKIDQSFVAGLPHDTADVAIVTTILSMAHNLNIEALAEGIEKPEQAEFLREHGCDSGQGYLFSRPLPADQLLTLLQEERIKRTVG